MGECSLSGKERDIVVRPRKCRMVDAPPDVTYFKPRGVPLSDLNEVYLPLDGYEALRLADHQGMTHDVAAGQMQVSRQTFGRILAQARQTVAKALVSGLALRIRGGNYTLAGDAKGEQGRPTKAKKIFTSAHKKHKRFQEKPTRQEVLKEAAMKKIAVTSEGPSLDDLLDPRFGRAAGFIIVDPQTLDFEYLDNGASQAMAQGAGIQAAENIANSEANVVLTGYVGPKAFAALEAAGIRIGQNMEDITVRQAVERFISGDVDWAQQANRQGHSR